MSTEKQLLKLIGELKTEELDDIGSEVNFIEALSLDSLDVVSLITKIGHEFGTQLGENPEDLDSLTSFGTLVDWINERKPAESA